ELGWTRAQYSLQLREVLADLTRAKHRMMRCPSAARRCRETDAWYKPRPTLRDVGGRTVERRLRRWNRDRVTLWVGFSSFSSWHAVRRAGRASANGVLRPLSAAPIRIAEVGRPAARTAYAPTAACRAIRAATSIAVRTTMAVGCSSTAAAGRGCNAKAAPA